MLSAPEMRAWRAFLRAYDGVMRALDADLRAAHDLGIPEYDVLVQLGEADERRLRMRDLARATQFSPSGLTRACERLERLGFVVRERSSDDARGTQAVLTAEGTDWLRAASAAHLARVHDWFGSQCSPDELAMLTATLDRISAAAPWPPD